MKRIITLLLLVPLLLSGSAHAAPALQATATSTPTVTPTPNRTQTRAAAQTWTAAVNGTMTSVVATLTAVATPTITKTPLGGGGFESGPPSTSDAQAVMRMAYSGNTLYVAGTISDDLLAPNSAGAINLGDALRIALDGLADGFRKPGQDDEDYYITTDGTVQTFDMYPATVTAAAVVTAGGWTFEMAIASSEIDIAALTAGTEFGLTYALFDADGQGVEHVLTDAKRMGVIQ